MKNADTKKMKSLKKISLLALAFALTPTFALAEGTSVGGGANSIQGELVDKVIFESKWNPQSDPAFKEYTLPTLNYIRQNLPHLADDLELILTKRWYKADKRIAVNTSPDVVLVSDQMAYQDKNAVFVDGAAYDKASPKARANMIIHELFQGLRIEKWLRSNKGKDEVGGSSVAILSQEIFERTPKNSEEMQELVSRYLQNTYGTAAQVKAFHEDENQMRRSFFTASSERGLTGSLCTERTYIFFGQLVRKSEQKTRLDYPIFRTSYFELDSTNASYDRQRVLYVPQKDKEALATDMRERLYVAARGGSQGDGFYRRTPERVDFTQFCQMNTSINADGAVIINREFQFKRPVEQSLSEGSEASPAKDAK